MVSTPGHSSTYAPLTPSVNPSFLLLLCHLAHGSTFPSSLRRSPLPVLFVSSRTPRRSIRAGEPPDGSTYQDGYGKTRKWTKDEMEGRKLQMVNPRTWFGYGKLTEISVSPPTADSAA